MCHRCGALRKPFWFISHAFRKHLGWGGKTCKVIGWNRGAQVRCVSVQVGHCHTRLTIGGRGNVSLVWLGDMGSQGEQKHFVNWEKPLVSSGCDKTLHYYHSIHRNLWGNYSAFLLCLLPRPLRAVGSSFCLLFPSQLKGRWLDIESMTT